MTEKVWESEPSKEQERTSETTLANEEEIRKIYDKVKEMEDIFKLIKKDNENIEKSLKDIQKQKKELGQTE